MTAAVHDMQAVAARRWQLFGGAPLQSDEMDRERYGSAVRHCGICPKPEGEVCQLSCETQRGALDDGVTVK